jgi:DNA (cytosine-5)-methyltransferase 1
MRTEFDLKAEGREIRVLNLYAGIGGNRKLWPDNVRVTAVELNEDIAGVYKSLFPNDNVIVGDAHQYLLDHYQEFDFIWASPPCPTHSKINYSNGGRWAVKYPDMKLYQEIILLQEWFKGKYVVENVISYYEPLIKPQESGRHYFWANFKIVKKDYGVQVGTLMHGTRKRIIREAQIPEIMSLHGFDLSKINIPNKRQVLRNCVFPELGLDVFQCAVGAFKSNSIHQPSLWNTEL